VFFIRNIFDINGAGEGFSKLSFSRRHAVGKTIVDPVLIIVGGEFPRLPLKVFFSPK